MDFNVIKSFTSIIIVLALYKWTSLYFETFGVNFLLTYIYLVGRGTLRFTKFYIEIMFFYVSLCERILKNVSFILLGLFKYATFFIIPYIFYFFENLGIAVYFIWDIYLLIIMFVISYYVLHSLYLLWKQPFKKLLILKTSDCKRISMAFLIILTQIYFEISILLFFSCLLSFFIRNYCLR